MAYQPEVIRRAVGRLEARRGERRRAHEELKSALYAQRPELADIDRQLRGTVLDIITSSLRQGTDPGPALQVIRDKNMDLQVRQTQLLGELGYPADALDETPACKKCGDTGWVGTRMCDCLKALCAQEQVRELGGKLDLAEQSFDTFSLDWYSPLPWPGESLSPRQNMEDVRDICYNYATKFGRYYYSNLLLTGDPGLGKTFLSACIARTVAENGFSVVYETAVELFARFEEQKFGRAVQEGEGGKDETRRYLSCDLLILDDLGSELTTPFVQSALYTLVNGRLTAGRATIISTNMTVGRIRERYNGQTASRMEGEYQVLYFYGEDIRLRKKERL